MLLNWSNFYFVLHYFIIDPAHRLHFVNFVAKEMSIEWERIGMDKLPDTHYLDLNCSNLDSNYLNLVPNLDNNSITQIWFGQ
jgi:hypothetical protein